MALSLRAAIHGGRWRTSLRRDPTFGTFLLPALLVVFAIYVRSPASNHIFDEQEALLANPYVAGDVPWSEVLRRDFWGLPPQRTIGSYRPLPNLIWRALSWPVLEPIGPWVLHLVNLVGHALVAAGLASFAFAVSGVGLVGWMTGGAFLLTAVLTEAVTGVVGLADILGGLGGVLALQALRLPLLWMPVGVFAALCLGFGGKESVVALVPLVGVAAFVSAPCLHPERPRPWARGAMALLAACVALVLYTELRKYFFPTPLPAELAEAVPTSRGGQLFHDFLVWFHQPKLPRDPRNNPLLDAAPLARGAGALGVYAAGLVQVFFPWSLSGDYSAPQLPAPQLEAPGGVWSLGSVSGALLFVVPIAVGAWIALDAVRRRPTSSARLLVGLALLWVPLAYFPHSNLVVPLPTVRAERFWYLPALGSALLVGVSAARLLQLRRAWAWALVVGFFVFQGAQARAHAMHYSDDLVFWRATKISSPQSAKAHLNYAVMVGARGDLPARLEAGQRAIELAPEWGMAHVYQGDVLCRLGRLEEAWHHYERGFLLEPTAQNQIALALQCLWDRGAIEAHHDRLLELADEHPGTWLGYLARDVVHNGATHRGVDPRYRPRGYNQGPRSEGTRAE